MSPRVTRDKARPGADSSLARDSASSGNGSVQQVYAYAFCVRRNLKNPHQKFRPSAADIYDGAGEVRGNEVDQLGRALFGQRSHERKVEVERGKVRRHARRRHITLNRVGSTDAWP